MSEYTGSTNSTRSRAGFYASVKGAIKNRWGQSVCRVDPIFNHAVYVSYRSCRRTYPLLVSRLSRHGLVPAFYPSITTTAKGLVMYPALQLSRATRIVSIVRKTINQETERACTISFTATTASVPLASNARLRNACITIDQPLSMGGARR